MCLEEKQFVWDCLCFFVSKKRLMISLPNQGPDGQYAPVFRGSQPLVREGLTSSVIEPDQTPINVG